MNIDFHPEPSTFLLNVLVDISFHHCIDKFRPVGGKSCFGDGAMHDDCLHFKPKLKSGAIMSLVEYTRLFEDLLGFSDRGLWDKDCNWICVLSGNLYISHIHFSKS